MDPSVGWNNLLVELFWPKSGLVQVMKNLESHEIKRFHFPGLESHVISLSVMESYVKLKFCLVDKLQL